MKIKKISIKNYRLLKNLSVDLEDDLSLILGKNNTGKTSFLSILEKFLGSNTGTFSFDDFSLDFQQTFLSTQIENNIYQEKSIQLKLYIEYTEEDDLEKISDLIMNLEPVDNILILSFEYCLTLEKYEELIADFNEYQRNINNKDILYFLKKNHNVYFKIKKKALESGNENNFIEINDSLIRKVINFQMISAKRGVANQEGSKGSDKTLSKLSLE